MIEVLIVDDNMVVRRALEIGISSFADVRCVDVFGSAREIIQFCEYDNAPYVVLLDIVMPGMDGVDFIAYAREIFPQLKIIALTSFETDYPRETVIEAGAHAYLVKNSSLVDIVQTIRRIAPE